MLLVALTGNIASGKSTVARRLAALGAVVVDADDLARRAVAPGSPALHGIEARWGPDVLRADGSLDRAALRALVFADPAELDALNALVHPEVERLREAAFTEARRRGAAVVVYDVPLLYERGGEVRFDRVVVVDAPEPVRLERLRRDRGLSHEEAGRMVAMQMPAAQKRARADFVIENDGGLDELEAQTDRVWREILSLSQSSSFVPPPIRNPDS